MDKVKTAKILITFIIVVGIVGVWFLEPIAQDVKYHIFTDQRTILTIPNFWNILSNLPFLLVGIAGLISIFASPGIFLSSEMKIAYILFFSGVALTAVGSGYYHLSPDNESLVWDRLPMTIVFMALFSIVIAEYISARLAKLILWPLIILGVFSVVYWHMTESEGNGDLRLYILVQFVPMMVIPLILLFFKSEYNDSRGYWMLLFAYAVAKVFEHFDEAIYNALPVLSGHSIKHIVAAIGIFMLLRMYNTRENLKVKD